MAVLVVAAAGVCLLKYALGEWTVSKLERLIQSEVPVGCDRHQVEVWFERHHIAHMYLTDTTADTSSGSTMPELAGLKSEVLAGMARGIIEGDKAYVHPILNGRISVYFFFDK